MGMMSRGDIHVIQFRDDELSTALRDFANWYEDFERNVWDVACHEEDDGRWCITVYWFEGE
jgi:hypothetical protein